MRLALRNGKRRVVITPEGVKRAYGIGKRVYNMVRDRFKKRLNPTQTAVPVNMGRSFMRIPVNLNRNMRKRMKSCSQLTSTKIGLFKSELIKKANKIYSYSGIYKAIQKNATDNENYNGMSQIEKTRQANLVYGGAIGCGRLFNGFTTDADISNTHAFYQGNMIAFNLDMPTGFMLPPNSCTSDTTFQGVKRHRHFGALGQSFYGTEPTTVLNQSEEFTNAMTTPPVGVNSVGIRSIYLLSYKYTFQFNNTTKYDYYCYIAMVKLRNFVTPDSMQWDGFSQFLNWTVTNNTNAANQSGLFEGKWPQSIFKMVRLKKILLKGSYNAINTDSGKNHRTVVIKSKKNYLTVCKRPSNQVSANATPASANWYDDGYHSNTYCYVWAVPASHLYNGQGATYDTPITPAQIMCTIRKDTKYCYLTD